MLLRQAPHCDQNGVSVSGQYSQVYNSSLPLIEVTCAGVTELPSVRERAIVD